MEGGASSKRVVKRHCPLGKFDIVFMHLLNQQISRSTHGVWHDTCCIHLTLLTDASWVPWVQSHFLERFDDDWLCRCLLLSLVKVVCKGLSANTWVVVRQTRHIVSACLQQLLQNCKRLFVVYLEPVRRVGHDVEHACLSTCCRFRDVAVGVDGQVVRQQKSFNIRVDKIPNIQKLVYDQSKQDSVQEACVCHKIASFGLVSVKNTRGGARNDAIFFCCHCRFFPRKCIQ